MSFTSPQTTPAKPSGSSTTLTTVLSLYLLPVIVVVGLFVLIALGKVDSATGVPLIAGIVGVHGGAAVANTSTSA